MYKRYERGTKRIDNDNNDDDDQDEWTNDDDDKTYFAKSKRQTVNVKKWRFCVVCLVRFDEMCCLFDIDRRTSVKSF